MIKKFSILFSAIFIFLTISILAVLGLVIGHYSTHTDMGMWIGGMIGVLAAFPIIFLIILKLNRE